MGGTVKILAGLPERDDSNTGPAGDMRHIQRAKAGVVIPVIASLSGSGNGDWTPHAGLLEEMGADALELNVYFVPTDPGVTAEAVESRYVDLVAAVVEATMIPVAADAPASGSSDRPGDSLAGASGSYRLHDAIVRNPCVRRSNPLLRSIAQELARVGPTTPTHAPGLALTRMALPMSLTRVEQSLFGLLPRDHQ
jgi:hypothetical protein